MSEADNPGLLTERVIKELKEQYYIVPRYAIWVWGVALAFAAVAFGFSGCLSVREAVMKKAVEVAEEKAGKAAEEKARVVADRKAVETVGQVFRDATDAAATAASTAAEETVRNKVEHEARKAADAALLRLVDPRSADPNLVDTLKGKLKEANEVLQKVHEVEAKLGTESVVGVSARLAALEGQLGTWHTFEPNTNWGDSVRATGRWRIVGDTAELLVPLSRSSGKEDLPEATRTKHLEIDLPKGIRPVIDNIAPRASDDSRLEDAGSILFRFARFNIYSGRCMVGSSAARRAENIHGFLKAYHLFSPPTDPPTDRKSNNMTRINWFPSGDFNNIPLTEFTLEFHARFRVEQPARADQPATTTRPSAPG